MEQTASNTGIGDSSKWFTCNKGTARPYRRRNKNPLCLYFESERETSTCVVACFGGWGHAYCLSHTFFAESKNRGSYVTQQTTKGKEGMLKKWSGLGYKQRSPHSHEAQTRQATERGPGFLRNLKWRSPIAVKSTCRSKVLASIHRRKHFWPTVALLMQSDLIWSQWEPPTQSGRLFIDSKNL